MTLPTEQTGGRDLLVHAGRIRVLSRAFWGVIDHPFVSLANFGLGVVVARLVSPTEFGAFGVAFAIYLVALNIVRGFATQPLMIRFSSRDARGFARGAAVAWWMHFAASMRRPAAAQIDTEADHSVFERSGAAPCCRLL